MAFLHAMLSGHTSLEAALVRILELLEEEAPRGRHSHADLIARVCRSIGERPAILTGETAAAADETRRFRSISAHAYDKFDRTRAGPAVQAATTLARTLSAQIKAFRDKIDP